jgi:multicomponent Na+:H+ antiporter subunit B
MIPYILLFALYVQFHGDFGPGGGFQAGLIFAAGFILYGLIFGIENARKVIPAWVTRVLLAIGLLLYGGTGIASFFMGGNFLNYSVLSHNPVSGQHLGILLVELGVGITVSATMMTIFFIFSSQDR